MTNAGAQILSIIERAERLNEEIAGLNGDKRDLFAEAKANGFDVKALKAVIAYRAKDADEQANHEANVDLYLKAVSDAEAARAPARAQGSGQ